MIVADIYKIYGSNKGARLMIGGVDEDKFSTASGFNQYFRAVYDPSKPEIIPLANISDYVTAPSGVAGLINISLFVRAPFNIPGSVFSNYAPSNSGSQVFYYIDPDGYSKMMGERTFASSKLKHFLVKGLTELASQWNGSTVQDKLDLEALKVLVDFSFYNARAGIERLNIRNADTLGSGVNPASDSVFNNLNLNNAGKKNVIYCHPDMKKIDAGNILYSLRIIPGKDLRFITDRSNIPATPVIKADIIGATYVQLYFTDIPTADFYEVWIKDFSDPDNIINRYFEFAEITDANKYLVGLKKETKYEVRIKAVDWSFNKGEFSNVLTLETIANDAVISKIKTGGTYVKVEIENYAVLAADYTITAIEIYVDSVLNSTVAPSSKVYAMYLDESTNYDIEVILKTTTIDLTSNSINVDTIVSTTADLFERAVAYYKMNETTGNAIDVVNGHNGVLNGSMTRDGEWYTYGGPNAYVEIPDHDDFSFVDNEGNNTDFTIKTEFVVTGWNSANRFWLVSKREENTVGVNEWQLFYNDGALSFGIWDANNNIHSVDFTTALNLNQKNIGGVSCINNVLYLYIGGVRVATQALPAGFQFFNGTSPVQLGNSTFASNLNLIGKQKENTIINGYGWTDEQWADVNNNGNGITI